MDTCQQGAEEIWSAHQINAEKDFSVLCVRRFKWRDTYIWNKSEKKHTNKLTMIQNSVMRVLLGRPVRRENICPTYFQVETCNRPYYEVSTLKTRVLSIEEFINCTDNTATTKKCQCKWNHNAKGLHIKKRPEICIVEIQCEAGNVIWQALNVLQVSDSHRHTSLLSLSHARVPALKAALPTKHLRTLSRPESEQGIKYLRLI